VVVNGGLCCGGMLNRVFTIWVADGYAREVDERALVFARWIVERAPY
jgi:hypothetical protein